jgi:hypothetical protein
MAGLRVGVEIQGPRGAVISAMATLPWMGPERIELDDDRSLVLLTTSFADPDVACAYAERRLRKSLGGMDLDLEVLSTEAFPPTPETLWLTIHERGTRPESDIGS